jgi:hypothetical protein
MDERIINYLIVKHLEDVDFSTHPHLRVRSAYILAKKEYFDMSAAEKTEILNKLGEDDERNNKEKL